MDERKKLFNFRCPVWLWEEFTKMARLRGLTPSAYLRWLMANELRDYNNSSGGRGSNGGNNQN